MTAAADIILISTAIQLNGILSYTLNIFIKNKTFVKKHATFHSFWKISSDRSKNLSATWNRLSQRQGQNDMHMRYTKWDAH